MDYYIFLWDMRNSTSEITKNEAAVLGYLNTIANFCLESVSELPEVQVVATGDGQYVLFPAKQSETLDKIVRPFAESVVRYADSLRSKYPNYNLRSILGRGSLVPTPLGENGRVMWELNSRLQAQETNNYTDTTINLTKK